MLDLNGLLARLITEMRAPFAAAGLLVLTVACTAGGSSAVVETSSPSPVPSVQPVTDIESFVQALEAAGYKVKTGPTVIPPAYGGFKKRAERITIAGGLVWAFEYPSVSAYEEMRSRISENGQRIGDAKFRWNPHIYGSGRLIVLLWGMRRTSTGRALEDVLGKQFAGV